MGKLKICVYAISKNESKFVKRWVESMKEADSIYVLDTGSTDNTVEELQKYGVYVMIKQIEPWRFDVARNESLKLVPEDTDICICTDLDEIFEPGWREKLENIWNENTNRARYNYNWSFDENGKPAVNFYIEKIHQRKGYKWTHPVHEVLSFEGVENIITIDNITLNHYPDKSKSRSSYLPLLELSVKECPEDDRNMHYLGREYMYYGRWNEAIDTLIRHLQLKGATWRDERAASMRFISRSYNALKRYDEARMWLDKAIEEAPYLRDAYVERALLEYQLGNLNGTYQYCMKALDIKTHPKTYINEPFSFDHTIYDLLSICTYSKEEYILSYVYAYQALKLSPNNERIKNNMKLIKAKIEENSQ